MMFQWTPTLRLVKRTGALLATALQHNLSRETLEAVAKRVPPAGMSSSQLQALLEDEFPSLGQQVSQHVSLYEALRSHPDLFTVEPSGKGKWCVRPMAPTDPNDITEDLKTVERYCAKSHREQRSGEGVYPLLPLEDVLLRTGTTNTRVADAIVEGASPFLTATVTLSVKPRRTPRAAHLFVDGDALPAVAVDDMCTYLGLIKEECSVCVVRRASSAPLSTVDIIAPDVVETHLLIEKKARELRYRTPGTLRDVIYMCSGRQFATYADHVAKLNEFPDADVYVCCPSRIELVQKKRVIPFVCE